MNGIVSGEIEFGVKHRESLKAIFSSQKIHFVIREIKQPAEVPSVRQISLP
jgi:hypothetical protein